MLTPSIVNWCLPWVTALLVATLFLWRVIHVRRKVKPETRITITKWLILVGVATIIAGLPGFAIGLAVTSFCVVQIEPGQVLVSQKGYYPYEKLDHGAIWRNRAKKGYETCLVASDGIYPPIHTFPAPDMKSHKTVECDATFTRPDTPYGAWMEWKDDHPAQFDPNWKPVTDRALDQAYKLHKAEILALTDPDSDTQQARFRAMMEPEVGRNLPDWLKLEPGIQFNFLEYY